MAELKNIRIAISGIYDYAFEELPSLQLPLPGHGAPEWVEKKRVYKVYRPSTVLQAACSKFKLLPLTHHHPKTPVDGSNFRELALGYTGENPFVDYLEDKDEVGIRSTLLIYDDEALNAYDSGEVQLSPGYVAEFEWNKGQTPKGEEYDIVMKKITDVNHLALLPCGRGGNDAVVMDNAAKRLTIFDLVKKTSDGAPEGNDNASKEHVKEEEKVKRNYRESKDELEANYKKIKELAPVDISNNKKLTSKQEAEEIISKIGATQNKSDGRIVNFPKTTVGKVITHKGYDYTKVFESLGSLFKNAQKIYSESETKMEGHKYHDNIEAYHNYVNKFSDGEKEYYIRFTSREEKIGKKNLKIDRKDQLHSYAISEIALYEIKNADKGNLTGSNPGESDNQHLDKRLTDFFETVNSNNEETTDSKEKAGFIIFSADLHHKNSKINTIFDIVKNKKTLWSAPHAQTQQQDTALNYGAKTENKVLSDFARGECSKGLNDSIDDVFISDKEIKIACSEVTDSSISRSNNGVGGQIQRQTGNREKENDAIASAGTFTPDTNRPGNLSSTETVIHSDEKRKSIFEIVSGTVFDRFK